MKKTIAFPILAFIASTIPFVFGYLSIATGGDTLSGKLSLVAQLTITHLFVASVVTALVYDLAKGD